MPPHRRQGGAHQRGGPTALDLAAEPKRRESIRTPLTLTPTLTTTTRLASHPHPRCSHSKTQSTSEASPNTSAHPRPHPTPHPSPHPRPHPSPQPSPPPSPLTPGVLEHSGVLEWCEATGTRPTLPFAPQLLVGRGSFYYHFPSSGSRLPTEKALGAWRLLYSAMLTVALLTIAMLAMAHTYHGYNYEGAWLLYGARCAMHPTFSHPLLGPPLHNLLFIHLSVPCGARPNPNPNHNPNPILNPNPISTLMVTVTKPQP